LTLLTALPETPERLHQELDLQVPLGAALIFTKGNGAPEVGRVYARARELCEQIGDTPQVFQVLRGLILHYVTRAQLQTALQLGEQQLRLAGSQLDPALLELAHTSLGIVLCHQGELTSAHTHHTQALAICHRQEHLALAVSYGSVPGLNSHIYLSWKLWYLGYPDQAMQHSQAARTLAQEASRPQSLAVALIWAAFLHQYRREPQSVYEQAAAATTLSTEHGLALWAAYGMILHGWALAMQGQDETGIAQIGQSLAAVEATGSKMTHPYFLGLLAESYGKDGHPEEGVRLLDEALTEIDNPEMDSYLYRAELYRLKGYLLLRQSVPDASQAETCFQKALDIARHQQAKSLELRDATSLARLWQSQDKRQDATDLLAPVYEWFTEGFDTADLQDAKALLAELGG